MTKKVFVVDCSLEARYRVEFVTEKGKIQEFVVQLEFMVGGEWRPVVRYDTAHGLPHCDAYAPNGTVTPHQPLRTIDYNEALTYAETRVREHWPELIRPFQEALS